MKYLILIVVVFAAIWWIRQQRPKQVDTAHTRNLDPSLMVPCAHCGTHIPQSDVIQGERGVYCSTAHRQAHEG